MCKMDARETSIWDWGELGQEDGCVQGAALNYRAVIFCHSNMGTQVHFLDCEGTKGCWSSGEFGGGVSISPRIGKVSGAVPELLVEGLQMALGLGRGGEMDGGCEGEVVGMAGGWVVSAFMSESPLFSRIFLGKNCGPEQDTLVEVWVFFILAWENCSRWWYKFKGLLLPQLYKGVLKENNPIPPSKSTKGDPSKNIQVFIVDS
ncbi:uncharacterized protein F5147DRAFT_650804 [Suillus discolor]|uniref:Uncharacterized protein n=1 Tax=Suillus discolor TaxID=1912936 RepID=A0A9P7FB40_9AGAM|nr:uncharacterized protein F5147DRAFT_650804 [Suillus discolor]KAG2112646.1 hypothetical protein F5147DRAFT_650804 [Suillus discolor]